MAVLIVAFAMAALPTNLAAASGAGSVNVTTTVVQRVALTLNAAAAGSDVAQTQSNVDNNVTSAWITDDAGSRLQITVVPAP
ncbi:MAG: hypothetical protein CVT67_06480 [Actinobacteria bacterium HGW-Actinobacteria-7]|jgi:hypothetical protein|nr:MAG: hypothetical protein CVT67_06480 [Actinobacteria bacterium HGW-Actinobacteria-7]